MKRFCTILLLIGLLVPAVYSLQANIGNGRAIIHVNATPEEPAVLQRSIQVNNKNNISVRIVITPDQVLKKFAVVQDAEFVLEPGQSKNAKYTLSIDRGGKFEGRLNVGFSPADPTVKQNGVGLAATIIIFSDGPILPEEPIIDEPEEDIIEEVFPENLNNLEPTNNSVSISTGGNLFPTKEDQGENDSANPNPMTGVLIIAIVVVIGLIIYYIISKFLK